MRKPERIMSMKEVRRKKVNETTHTELIAVETFAQGLIKCFESKKETFHEPIADVILDYAVKVVNIHLDLKRLEFEQYALNQQKTYEK